MGRLQGLMSVPPNEQLRDYVTRVGFNLTLGRTQIAALVMLDRMLKENRHIYVGGRKAGAFAHFVPGTWGLLSRGLVTHTDPEPMRQYKNGNVRGRSLRRVWSITKAGRLVIGLLKESGLYDDYAGALSDAERAKARASY